MNIKEWIFDRIDTTFTLFKNNFLWLFLPFFLYNFISVVVIWTIVKYYMMTSMAWIETNNIIDLFTFLNNPTVVILILLWIILFILYLLLYIIILLWFIKSVKQALSEEKITILENVQYWINSFWLSMKTYWYIFSYVALIPSLIFILWWILFNLSYYLWNLESLQILSLWIIGLSLIIFIIFLIYRWTKATFAIYSAVDDNTFDKENFNSSISITQSNWWRIFWNFLLLGIMISIILSIIGTIISLVSFFGSWGWSLLKSLLEINSNWWNFNLEKIKLLLEWYVNNFSILSEILSNILDNIIKTISTIFVLIFTYIFYIRLKYESNKEEKIEL